MRVDPARCQIEVVILLIDNDSARSRASPPTRPRTTSCSATARRATGTPVATSPSPARRRRPCTPSGWEGGMGGSTPCSSTWRTRTERPLQRVQDRRAPRHVGEHRRRGRLRLLRGDRLQRLPRTRPHLHVL